VPGYFIDTSALAKLYHTETGSDRMELLVQSSDTRLVISQLSLIEIESVFASKVRTSVIDKAAPDQLRGLFFADLAKGRFEAVRLAGRHMRSAEALVRVHAVDRMLRTLDAIQLSVALDLKRRGAASGLAASDRNLCAVATAEGLAALNPTQGG
jgi:predicted nucleic acid-binding protein